jgi:hypothetical protein
MIKKKIKLLFIVHPTLDNVNYLIFNSLFKMTKLINIIFFQSVFYKEIFLIFSKLYKTNI